MPHLSIEYSAGLENDADMSALCMVLRDTMVECGFPTAGIRVRAHRADHFVVADGVRQNAFVATSLVVGSGRSKVELKAAGERIFSAAQNAFKSMLAEPYFSLSLEIREMDPDLSWKDTPIHARLSGKM